MEESSRLTAARSRPSRSGRSEFGDDECSTDSGCSSGGSTGSAERLSRRGSGERLCGGDRSPRVHCYLDRLRGRGMATRSQERPSRRSSSSDRCEGGGRGAGGRGASAGGAGGGCRGCGAKSPRSWSPGGEGRSISSHANQSPSHSLSPSDAQSSSDSDSTAKRFLTTETIRKAFQSFKISSRQRVTKEKKHAKKSPKSILRSPVSYTYVRGLSGLPTHRVPRNLAPRLMLPCACQDIARLNR